MGLHNRKVTTHQPKSQATPLGEDILDMLRKQLTGSNFGEGFGPLQREAGTATRQFIENRQTPDQFLELMGPLREMFNRETDKGVADMKEGQTLSGTRLGASSMRAEGTMRGDRATDLDALMSQMFLQEQAQLLAAINSLYGQGVQNTQPFFDFGALGILPEMSIMEPTKFERAMQWMNAVGSLIPLSGGRNQSGSPTS